MSKAFVIEDELYGFHPGNQGYAVQFHEEDGIVTIASKYAVDFEADRDGWDWSIGQTRLNVLDITNLRNYLNEVLEGLNK